jgi:CzcA family heavy metal efflux pump
MRWIVASSLRFRWLVVAAATALLFFGFQGLQNEKVDVFPEFSPVLVQIETSCVGLSTSEVESLVTVPIEDSLNGTPGVDTIRSSSVGQLSSIVLQFKQGTNELEARQLVQERLQAVAPTLPTWAAPPQMLPRKSATSRVLQVGLSSKTVSPLNLSMIAATTVKARLLHVPGVAAVSIWGQRLTQLQVQARPSDMLKYGMTFDSMQEHVADALDAGTLKFARGSAVGSVGNAENATQRMPIQDVLPIIGPLDLARISLDSPTGKRLRLSQIADVKYGHAPLVGDAVIDGGPGLLLVVDKYPGANTLEVTKGLDKAIKDLQPGLPGIHIDKNIFRPATFIQTAVDNLSIAVLIGCFLVALILVAFLFEWRAAVISLAAIPLSLGAAALVLSIGGATINTLVLAGFAVAVGVVVDDAIIDMENIVRRLRQRRAEGITTPIGRVVLEASLEVRSAILYATLINVVAVIPVIVISGLSGAFFRPLALAYALAVLASMVVALTVTPALALLLLQNAPLKRREAPLVTWLKRGYTALLMLVIRGRRIVIGAAAAVALLALFALPTLGQDLFPTFKERDFLMHWIAVPSASIKDETRSVTNVSHELAKIHGIQTFGSHIGQALGGEEIAGPNFGENWVSISPNADYDKTVDQIRALEEQYPGVFHDVQTYLRERIDEVLTGATEAIVVRINGPDLRVLRQKSQEIEAKMGKLKGLVDVHADIASDVPQPVVKVNLPVARRYGVKPGEVRRNAGELLGSEEVGDIFRGGKIYGVAVWTTPNVRQNLTDVKNLPIDAPGHGHVPLSKVAHVKIQPEPNVITREDASRYIDVTANVKGTDIGTANAEVKKAIESTKLPLGYEAVQKGEAQERAAANRNLLLYAIVAAVAIFLLLQAAFGSWRLATVLFASLPMALAGGLLAAYTSVGVISLGALIGFYTVLGIAARNGIMMISHFQHLEKYEDEPFGLGLVIRGAQERLAPILMTALATALAVTPLVISGDKPGQEIEHPMAIVILGGIITSTLINLFLLPALYLKFGERRERRAAAKISAA